MHVELNQSCVSTRTSPWLHVMAMPLLLTVLVVAQHHPPHSSKSKRSSMILRRNSKISITSVTASNLKSQLRQLKSMPSNLPLIQRSASSTNLMHVSQQSQSNSQSLVRTSNLQQQRLNVLPSRSTKQRLQSLAMRTSFLSPLIRCRTMVKFLNLIMRVQNHSVTMYPTLALQK